MSNLEVVHAWKDPDFRATLGGVMIDHPAGQIELADPDLSPSSARNVGFRIDRVKHYGHSKFCSILTTNHGCCHGH